MTDFVSKNKDLLLVGAVLVGGFFLLSSKKTDNGGGGGSETIMEKILGTNGGGISNPNGEFKFPVIESAPPTFNINEGGSVLDGQGDLFKALLAVLGNGAGSGTTTSKKSTALDAGEVFEGVVLPAPFLSRNAGVLNGGSYFTTPAVSGFVKDGNFDSVNFAISNLNIDSKKNENITPLGFSGQYFIDPISGYNQWNNYAGFGLSTDSTTGKKVSFQRDTFIFNADKEVLYNPITGLGNSLIAIGLDNKKGTYGASRPLDALEMAQVIAQSNPNYVVGSWDSKKGTALYSSPNSMSSVGTNGYDSSPSNFNNVGVGDSKKDSDVQNTNDDRTNNEGTHTQSYMDAYNGVT